MDVHEQRGDLGGRSQQTAGDPEVSVERGGRPSEQPTGANKAWRAMPMTHAAQDFSRSFASRTIYGFVVVLAVLAVMQNQPPSAWTAAITLFGTTLAIALAEAYSEIIAGIIAEQRHPTRAELRRVWSGVSPVLIGAQVPAVVLLLSALGFFPIEQALTLAEIAVFLLLFSYGWRVAVVLHENWIHRVLAGLLFVGAGALVVGIKTLFH
jgi:hemolysin III